MIIITGLLSIIGPRGMNTGRIINIMWIYGLVSSLGGRLKEDIWLWNGIVKIGSNEWIIGIILIILGGISQNSMRVEGNSVILLIITGMWMTVISKEWISIILSIELQSNGIYLLVCKRSISSGLRYNIIGGISSSIMMISLLRVYSESGLSNIEEIKIWKEYEEKEIGIYGVILGLLIKMGTAPVHNWISDVMENISVEENKWVGGISKIPLIKIISEWGGKEIIPIILTLGIGGILGSTAYRIKKFIAYSGIHNLGYVLIISNSEGGWIFFITQYVITLISILMIYKENITIWSIREENGKGEKWKVITITISMLSSIGIPPLIGFYGKLSIIEWGIENGWGIITIIIVMGSVLSARNYIRIIKNAQNNRRQNNNREEEKMSSEKISIGILVSLMVSNIVERYTRCI